MNVTRIKEPSTWAGIGGLFVALDKIFDINEAASVGDSLVSAVDSGADLTVVVSVLVASLFGIFLPERGQK